MRKIFLYLGFLLSLCACTKQYPLTEYQQNVSQPVLLGYIDTKYGINLNLTRTLSPIEQDTADISITGANIYLVSTKDDTIRVFESSAGIYTNSDPGIDINLTYALYAKILDYEDVVIPMIKIPDQPFNTRISLDTSELSDKTLLLSLELEDKRISDYWYWYRFAGDSTPQWTVLENQQLYDLCEANNYTNSAEIVFSSTCATNNSLRFTFRSNYLPGRVIPKKMTLEIVRIDPSFGRYLQSLSTIADLDFARLDPPGPISNTNIGIGYVAPLHIYDTTLVLP